MSGYAEDTLVKRTTTEYMEQQLHWKSVYAYDDEDFGPDSLLCRGSLIDHFDSVAQPLLGPVFALAQDNMQLGQACERLLPRSMKGEMVG